MDDTAQMHAPRPVPHQDRVPPLPAHTPLARQGHTGRRPGIVDEVITEPLVVTGPARSGTTLLLELLDLDPSLHARGWEIATPVRRRHATRWSRCGWQRRSTSSGSTSTPGSPRCTTYAPRTPRSASTCRCRRSGRSTYWPMVAEIPGWTPTWFHDAVPPAGAAVVAARHRRPHVGAQDPRIPPAARTRVTSFYPDTSVVHTHATPARTATSSASTLAERPVDPQRPCRAAEHRGRRRHGHVAAEPHGTAQEWRTAGSHRRRALRRPDGRPRGHRRPRLRGHGPRAHRHADAIGRYVANRPKGALGQHAYSADQYGIDVAAVRERMLRYADYYGVRLE